MLSVKVFSYIQIHYPLQSVLCQNISQTLKSGRALIWSLYCLMRRKTTFFNLFAYNSK